MSHGLSQAPKEYAAAIAHYILNSQGPIPAVITAETEMLTAQAFECGKSFYATSYVGCHKESGLGVKGVGATLVNNGGVAARAPVNGITTLRDAGKDIRSAALAQPGACPAPMARI